MVTPQYTHQLDTDSPIMLVDQAIGFDADTPNEPFIDGSQFVKELLFLDTLGKKKIQVWINSIGGMVMDAMEIYHAIRTCKTPVETKCVGYAISSAGIIFQAGSKRVMTNYGQIMMHNPQGGDKKSLDATKESIVKMYADRCKVDEDEISKLMNRTSWILASDTECKFLWDVVENVSENTSYNEIKAQWKMQNLVISNSLNKNSMKKEDLAALGLSEDATPEQMSSALAKVISDKTAAETAKVTAEKKLAKVKNKVKDEDDDGDVEDRCDKLEKKMDGLMKVHEKHSAAIDAFLTKHKEAEDKAKNAEAVAIVNKHIERIGGEKVDPAIKNEWVSKAIADPAGTEKILEALPVNKKSPSFEEKPLAAGEMPTNAMTAMAQVIAKNKKK